MNNESLNVTSGNVKNCSMIYNSFIKHFGHRVPFLSGRKPFSVFRINLFARVSSPSWK